MIDMKILSWICSQQHCITGFFFMCIFNYRDLCERKLWERYCFSFHAPFLDVRVNNSRSVPGILTSQISSSIWLCVARAHLSGEAHIWFIRCRQSSLPIGTDEKVDLMWHFAVESHCWTSMTDSITLQDETQANVKWDRRINFAPRVENLDYLVQQVAKWTYFASRSIKLVSRVLFPPYCVISEVIESPQRNHDKKPDSLSGFSQRCRPSCTKDDFL